MEVRSQDELSGQWGSGDVDHLQEKAQACKKNVS